MSREAEMYREALIQIRKDIEKIVCTVGLDTGVIMLSSEGPTHYDPLRKCQVYDHAYFSPLGDALIELYEKTTIVDGSEFKKPAGDEAK